MSEPETPVSSDQAEQSAPSVSETPVVPVVSGYDAANSTDQQPHNTIPLQESHEPQRWAQPFSGHAASSQVVDAAPTASPQPSVAAYPSYSSYPPYSPYAPYTLASPDAPYPPPLAATRDARLQRRAMPGSARLWASIAGLAMILCLLVSAFAIGRISAVSATTTTTTTTQSGQSAQSAQTVAVAPSAQDLQQTVVNVVRTVQPAVVEVTSRSSSGEAIGSGNVIRQDGYIVTNDHVVNGYTSFTVTFSSGKTLAATVVGQDAQDDLAVVKVAATGLQTIAIANSNTVQVGQFAVAVGSPLGLQQSASFGIVSALNRNESEGQGGPAGVLTGLVQTSAPINPGNSGGALVNLQGQLIGIPTLGAANTQTGGSADGIGFAIPASRVSFVAAQLIASGHLTHTGQGFLGIQGQDANAAQSTAGVAGGVMVTGFAGDVSGGSPGQQARLQSGDVIIAVNGQTVATQTDLAGMLFSQAPGAKVTLTILRNGNQQTIAVTLGERPVNAQG
ncbi:MAG: trypsin-like peptidase domain-containing protein [Ktedonobacterales bacterium]